MGDKTVIVDRAGARVRYYYRQDPERPGQQERRRMAAQGLSWCRDCKKWLTSNDVYRGQCKPHIAKDARDRYAEDENFREARRHHSVYRKRGVEPVPSEVRAHILEEFDGECSYCDDPATTWDHVIPVTKGGKTTPDNMLPACTPCNSSKGMRDLDDWLAATGREMKMQAKERLVHFGGINAD